MKKITAVIVDDEVNSIEALQWELEPFQDIIEIVATCDSAMKGIEAIKKYQPQLVFLDIEMPKMNGFEMLKKIAAINFDVIFTTAYDEFALKAFKVNALDYLLKPIDEEELKLAIDKVKERNTEPITQLRLESIFKTIMQSNPKFPNIALPTLEGLEFIEVASITHCQSEGNYTNIFQKNGHKTLVSKTLKDIETMLEGHHFLRVHHSFLVNLIYVRKYYKGKNGYLELINKISIPVSRAKKEALLKRF